MDKKTILDRSLLVIRYRYIADQTFLKCRVSIFCLLFICNWLAVTLLFFFLVQLLLSVCTLEKGVKYLQVISVNFVRIYTTILINIFKIFSKQYKGFETNQSEVL